MKFKLIYILLMDIFYFRCIEDSVRAATFQSENKKVHKHTQQKTHPDQKLECVQHHSLQIEHTVASST